MPETTLGALVATAAAIGFLHTVTGPDHFLPFIALAKAGSWSFTRTMVITSLCGIAHVASSVVLGLAGLAVGAALARLVGIEEFRGSVAGWLLFGFGLAYLVWGLRHAWGKRLHAHSHFPSVVGTPQDGADHSHPHQAASASSVITPWIVFLIFAFGPCEPLIPLLMYPAAESSLAGSMLVASVFGATTLSTMLAMVAAGYLGLARLSGGAIERYGHAACGGAIALCGAAVVFGL